MADLVPHLASFSALLLRFGEDKASEGLLGVLGLGKKSPYSHRSVCTKHLLNPATLGISRSVQTKRTASF